MIGKNEITKEEFRRMAREEDDWAPGWDAIEEEMSRLYPEQKPVHYATNMTSRAIFGGDEYLDGYSIYTSSKGYKHIVTFGMTELYADEEMFGREWNKWGYEMTFKLKEDNIEDCLWAMNMLGNLARYTYTKELFFEPFEYIAGNGSSLHIGKESLITGLLVVLDPELQTLYTLYGREDFILLFGITEAELQAIKENPKNAKKLYEMIKKDNPDFVTDMNRQKSYF